MPLLILPLPLDLQDEIEDIIAERLPEQHLEEPFAYKVLEFFGFWSEPQSATVQRFSQGEKKSGHKFSIVACASYFT